MTSSETIYTSKRTLSFVWDCFWFKSPKGWIIVMLCLWKISFSNDIVSLKFEDGWNLIWFVVHYDEDEGDSLFTLIKSGMIIKYDFNYEQYLKKTPKVRKENKFQLDYDRFRGCLYFETLSFIWDYFWFRLPNEWIIVVLCLWQISFSNVIVSLYLKYLSVIFENFMFNVQVYFVINGLIKSMFGYIWE